MTHHEHITPTQLRVWLAEHSPETLLADGFDEALIGIVRQFSRHLALYDYRACVRILQSQGMTEEDAVEYMEFNVLGGWVGTHTPLFVDYYDPQCKLRLELES